MRHTSGARSGLTIWLLQRASAVWLMLVFPVFLFCLALGGRLEYTAWVSMFHPLFSKLMVLLTLAAILVHAWIGLREVMMDYVHPLRLRLPLLFVFLAGALLCFGWTAHILWSVA